MKMNVDQFFSEIVFGWMYADIQREIDLAKHGKKTGNVLCAIALMAYTEAMGHHLPKSRRPGSGAKNMFNAFFREMGKNYVDLLDVSKINVYDTFRCGLLHEYVVKDMCTIAMLNTPGEILHVAGAIDDSHESPHKELTIDIKKPVTCAIGKAINGSYYFVVEKYLEDFKSACQKLQHELNVSQENNGVVINRQITSESN